jgi:HEAT repeat protein
MISVEKDNPMAIIRLALFPGLSLVVAGQDDERVQKLIRGLDDPNKEERDKAVKELAKIGRPALGALQKATSSSDSEVKALAAQAIEKLRLEVEVLKRQLEKK